MLLFNKNLNNKNKNKNKNIGPMDITNEPWLYFKRDNIQSNPTSKYGKYILWYDVKYMNYMWNYAKQLFNDGLLEEIEYIKCTTSYAYPNNSYEFEGSIMLYCNLFNKIMKNILKITNIVLFYDSFKMFFAILKPFGV